MVYNDIAKAFIATNMNPPIIRLFLEMGHDVLMHDRRFNTLIRLRLCSASSFYPKLSWVLNYYKTVPEEIVIIDRDHYLLHEHQYSIFLYQVYDDL